MSKPFRVYKNNVKGTIEDSLMEMEKQLGIPSDEIKVRAFIDMKIFGICHLAQPSSGKVVYFMMGTDQELEAKNVIVVAFQPEEFDKIEKIRKQMQIEQHN